MNSYSSYSSSSSLMSTPLGAETPLSYTSPYNYRHDFPSPNLAYDCSVINSESDSSHFGEESSCLADDGRCTNANQGTTVYYTIDNSWMQNEDNSHLPQNNSYYDEYYSDQYHPRAHHNHFGGWWNNNNNSDDNNNIHNVSSSCRSSSSQCQIISGSESVSAEQVRIGDGNSDPRSGAIETIINKSRDKVVGMENHSDYYNQRKANNMLRQGIVVNGQSSSGYQASDSGSTESTQYFGRICGDSEEADYCRDDDSNSSGIYLFTNYVMLHNK